MNILIDTDEETNITTISPASGSSIAPLSPAKALPIRVELGLTITFTVLYSSLFLIVYIQLCMILYYKYKRFSYQSFFLMVCLIWAALRTVLFSFYFENTDEANNLPKVLYWLLYCCPLCLQFIILSVMVLYFSQLYFKVRNKPQKYRNVMKIMVQIAVVTFCTTNIVCAFLQFRKSQTNASRFSDLILIRVVICQLLFMTGGISLSIFIYKLSRCSSSKLLLESKGLTVCQAVVACFCLILLFASRAAYNFVVIIMRSCHCMNSKSTPSFNFNWINISDQAELGNVTGSLYVTFGIALFMWEFLPTFLVVILYRVRRPPSTPKRLLEASTHSHSSRVYFFDNPRRYDSDEDLNQTIDNISSSGINFSRSGRSVSAQGFASSCQSTGQASSSIRNGSFNPSRQYSSSSPRHSRSMCSQSVPSTPSKLLVNPIVSDHDR